MQARLEAIETTHRRGVTTRVQDASDDEQEVENS